MFRDCKRALSFFVDDWRFITIYLSIIATQIFLGLLLSWPMAILIDSVLSPQPRTDVMHKLFLALLPTNPAKRIVGIAAIGLIMKVAQDVLTAARQMLFYRINNFGAMRARSVLYQKISNVKALQNGDGMYRILSDTQGPQTILHALIGGGIAIANLFVMLTIMIVSCNGTLTIIALSVAPFLAVANHWFRPRIKARTLAAKEVDSELTEMCGYAEIVYNPLERFRKGAIYWLRFNWEQEKYNLAVHSIFSIAGTIIFTYGFWLVYRDQHVRPVANGMTIGTMCVFLDYMGKIWEPLGRLLGLSAEIQPGIAGVERMNEVLDRDCGLERQASSESRA